MIRALDAHLADASYREIADALYAADGHAVCLEDILHPRSDDPSLERRNRDDERRLPQAAARRLRRRSIRLGSRSRLLGVSLTGPSDSIILPASLSPPPWPANRRRRPTAARMEHGAALMPDPLAGLPPAFSGPRGGPLSQPLRSHTREAPHLWHRPEVPEDRRPRRLCARRPPGLTDLYANLLVRLVLLI